MAAAIERECKLTPALVRGQDGVFDVRADGALVFSKHETGRFPTEGELVACLRERSRAAAPSGPDPMPPS